MGWVSHLEYYWREPSFARFLRRLAGFSRLILFDKRGTGLSDPVTRDADARAAHGRRARGAGRGGLRRAALLGVSEGGPMCALFAATYPETNRGAGDGRAPTRAACAHRTIRGRRRRKSAKRSATRSSSAGVVRSASRSARRAWRRSGVPRLVGHLPPDGRQPRGGGRAHADERADRHPSHPADRARAGAGHAPHR